VITNDPRSADRRRLLEHIIKSIGGTRRKQHIRIISWNLNSRGFVDKLLAAHRRGVSVRVLIADGKSLENNEFWRLKRELHEKRPRKARVGKKYRSWARTCEGSCRGTRGIAHSKFFLFSRAGKAPRVVMSTSANATEVSVNYQWNDLYTLVGNRKIYRGFVQTFVEATRDEPVQRAFREFRGESVTGYVYPWKGKDARGDRVIQELKRITCNGAKGGTGLRGKTRIRIAQDAIIDQRGIDIARILRHKWESGCHIRIVYALMGKQVRGILTHTSRGPVPIRQIVNDYDEDGIYDRYLHSKSMAVSGWYRQDRSSRVAWQGSENWSGLAKLSDEQGFQIRRGGAEGVYARWIDYLFENPPVTAPKTTARIAAARGVDPYALIREELGLPARTP
jgi:phosphatidylserine/phosphatidylglycerophosphate/cardiolipin synthase-like enzyme